MSQSGGNSVSGTVLSKTDSSITVKTASGSSKTIYYSTSTKFSSTATASSTDIVEGSTVTIAGSSNSDNSLSATKIEISD